MSKLKKEIFGAILFFIGIIIFISQLSYDPFEEPSIDPNISINNIFGIFGIYISHYLMKLFIGWGSLFFSIIIVISGTEIFFQRSVKPWFRSFLYLTIFAFLSSLWLALYEFFNIEGMISYNNSGLVGGVVGKFLNDFIGFYGFVTFLIVSTTFLCSNYFKFSISDLLIKIYNLSKYKVKKIKNKYFNKDKENISQFNIVNQNISNESIDIESKKNQENVKNENIIETNKTEIKTSSKIPENNKDFDKKGIDNFVVSKEKTDSFIDEKIEIGEVEKILEGNLDELSERKSRYLEYKLPSINLLSNKIEFDEKTSKEVLTEKANQLEHALETFNVHGKVVRISPGPVITLFEIEPAEGVRVNKFTNLSDDLARVMRAQSVRIIAPIPGSKSVGIELPNENPEIVYMRNILNSEKYIESKSKLTLAIGRTTSGEAYVYDLAKMPHLLIAGATGAGKSVCINTIIISILYKAKPDEVKFIMIDPKKLELSAYKSLVGYHLITSPDIEEYVMTTADNAVSVLRAALVEMERRYEVFADATVRNISEYLNKADTNPELEKIPYLVVLIDELADLMITSGRDVEEPITRLAQMARAVGIHLIVATQRPSVDVITGLIKANFPARIAFQVSSKIDSRTIIDQMGAELLLGRGDMLFLPPGKSSPTRLHNALIELDEIEKILEHIEKQPKPDEKHLPKARKKTDNSDFNIEGQDELLMDAAKLVIEYRQASVSLLQRKFRIGYSRAGRLVDELESLGIISGYSGSKAREVLVDSSYLETLAQ